jgi:hypothetical protein
VEEDNEQQGEHCVQEEWRGGVVRVDDCSSVNAKQNGRVVLDIIARFAVVAADRCVPSAIVDHVALVERAVCHG